MNEHVTKMRWAGILLIMSGAIIVGRTTPRTTPEHEQDFENGDYK
jgi:drug/metabolite transporter (DMT)-like permease